MVRIAEKFMLVISVLSFLLLLIAININLELDDLFYYLGGTHHEVSNSVDGRFNLRFLLLLSGANLALILSLLFYEKNSLNSFLFFAVNTIFFFLNFNLTQYRVFQGFSFNPETDSYLQASGGDGFGYLFVSGTDMELYMIIIFHLSILMFQKYKNTGWKK